MDMLLSLWLPIALSAVAVWIASAIAWTVLPHHSGDMKGLPDENAFIAALRQLGIPPGRYGFPHCGSHKAGKDPEFQKKWKEGPAGELTVWRQVNMGRNLLLTFLVHLLISFFVGYIASASLARGASFGEVFQIAATAGVLGHAFGHLPNGIWFQHGRNAMIACLADGVAYGLITGAVFALLWPGLPTP